MLAPAPRRWTGPVYRARVDVRAPLAFVYRWCTDYRADDARREGERYVRRVLARSDRHVVFEDLEADADGWAWSRAWVTLRPPDRWHAERRGNRREYTVEYRLVALAPTITRLEFACRRRSLVPERPMRKSARERTYDAMWRRFGRALEADYRRAGRRRSVRRRPSRGGRRGPG